MSALSRLCQFANCPSILTSIHLQALFSRGPLCYRRGLVGTTANVLDGAFGETWTSDSETPIFNFSGVCSVNIGGSAHFLEASVRSLICLFRIEVAKLHFPHIEPPKNSLSSHLKKPTCMFFCQPDVAR